MRSTFRPAVAMLLLLALTLPAAAYAKSYRVDVLIFLDRGNPGDEQPVPASAPASAHGIPPSDTSRLTAAGIQMLPSSGLQQEWARLRNSGRFRPLLHLSWVQSGAASGTPLRIAVGPTIGLPDGNTIDAVSGHIALYTGTFLHLDAKLAYTFDDSDGQPVSYRLDEVRRVKFDALHYIDSPRVGILARVTHLQ